MSVVLLLLAVCVVPAHGFMTFDISSSSWRVSNANGSVRAEATVPGYVHLDLLRAGVIGDPYLNDNELLQRWVAFDNWTYTSSFAAPDALLEEKTIHVVLDGIDTIASVSLNGRVVGSASNMHLRHRFDVTSMLVQGINTLQVALTSAAVYAAGKSDEYPYAVPFDVHVGSVPHRNFIRKAQSDFGWDWGPAFIPCGIWKPVSLVGFSGAVVERLIVRQEHLPDGTVSLNATALVRAAAQGMAGTVSLDLDGESVGTTSFVSSSAGAFAVTLPPFVVAVPRYWWPVGYGLPNMYAVSASAYCNGETSTVTRHVGLRKVELAEEAAPAGAGGTMFYFRINGVPVWAKGANWIPADVFHTRADRDRIASLLQSALDANMNMIRVWGGGIYQPDEFYEFCDVNGLMVWQEFMFACAMYPTDDAFLREVDEEVSQALWRLQSHPSIVIFGGNNENEAALTWFSESVANRDLYVIDYWRLYVETVRRRLLSIDPDRPFVDSSPSNGIITDVPYTKRWGSPGSLQYGDIHFYDYFDDIFAPQTYPAGRFVSEFGFQSHTSLLGYVPVLGVDVGSLSFDSPPLERRQRHGNGTAELVGQLWRHFNATRATSPGQFGEFAYLTQVQQAVTYATAAEKWRRSKALSPGYTMGLLYWQLNDIWQAPTWSSLEYDGRWKLLHYFARRFFAPLIVSAEENQGNLNVFVTSDRLCIAQGVVRAELWGWDGRAADVLNLTFSVAPLDSSLIATIPIDDWMLRGGLRREEGLIRLVLSAGSAGDSYAIFHPAPIGSSQLRKARVQILSVAARAPKGAMARPAATANSNRNVEYGGNCASQYVPPSSYAATADESLPSSDLAHLRVDGAFVGAVKDSYRSHAPLPAKKPALSATTEVVLTLRTDVPAAFVTLSSWIAGQFEDNGFHMFPGEDVQIAFVGSAPFEVSTFTANLSVMSVSDTLTDG